MAREFKGGYYKMNHESFGAMMVSEQLRKPLKHVAKMIAAQAGANTAASSGTPDADRKPGPHLANSYRAERGEIVVIKGQTGIPGPRISERVVNPLRHAAVNEFGTGRPKASLKGLRGKVRATASKADVEGPNDGRPGTRDLRRAGMAFGDLTGE